MIALRNLLNVCTISKWNASKWVRIYPHHHGNIRPLFFRNELIVDDHSVSLRFSLACRLLSSYILVVTKTKIMLMSHFSITQSDRCTHGTLDNLNVRIGGNSCTTRPTSISLCPGDMKRQNELHNFPSGSVIPKISCCS